MSLIRLVLFSLIAALLGFNGFWLYRNRPAESLKTIDGWIARGNTQAAEPALRRLLVASPHNGDARMRLARLLASRDDYLNCAYELRQVPFWFRDKPEALFLEGQAYKLTNRARDAEEAWKECSLDDPLHPKPPQFQNGAARELIGYYLLENRLDEARETLWRGYDFGSPADRPGILLMRMRAELERISHEECLAKLRRFVAVNPEDWQARRALAFEEQWINNESEADKHIQACLKARPDDPKVWRTYLDILHQRGNRESLLAAISLIPTAINQDPEIWKYRGLAREWSGDLEAAAEAFRKAIALNPLEAEYFYKLGGVEQRLGLTDQAGEHGRQSKQLRRAFGAMRDAYHELMKITQNSRLGAPDYNAAVERLAAACESLGWLREAKAWRELIAPPPDAA